jgi:hypothetical protein
VSRRDVPGSVVVGVGTVPAGPTPESSLALASLPIHGPAPRATLAGVGGLDLLDPAAGLVPKPGGEHAPPGSENCTVQAGLLPDVVTRLRSGAPGRASHPPHVQVLKADQVVAPGDLGRHLLRPVPPRIGVAGVQPRQLGLDLGAAVGAALGARQATLQPLHVAVSRGLVGAPVRQGERHRHAPVDPHHFACGRSGNRSGESGECHVPAPGPVTGHSIGLRVGHRARPAKPDPAEFRDQHLRPAAVEAPHVLRSRGDDPEALVHVALAPRRRGWCRWPLLRRQAGEALAPLAKRSKPGGVGGVEVTQRLLLHDHAAVGQPRERGAGLGKLAALLGVPRRPTAWLPPRPLLHRQVPDIPGVRTMPQEQFLLRGCGVQPVAAHARNLAATCDNKGRERRFLPSPKTGTSTPLIL